MPLPDWLREAGRCSSTAQKQATGLCFLKKMDGMQTDRAIRQRGRAELFADLANLEDVDFVSLDGVEVVVHGQ